MFSRSLLPSAWYAQVRRPSLRPRSAAAADGAGRAPACRHSRCPRPRRRSSRLPGSPVTAKGLRGRAAAGRGGDSWKQSGGLGPRRVPALPPAQPTRNCLRPPRCAANPSRPPPGLRSHGSGDNTDRRLRAGCAARSGNALLYPHLLTNLFPQPLQSWFNCVTVAYPASPLPCCTQERTQSLTNTTSADGQGGRAQLRHPGAYNCSCFAWLNLQGCHK